MRFLGCRPLGSFDFTSPSHGSQRRSAASHSALILALLASSVAGTPTAGAAQEHPIRPERERASDTPADPAAAEAALLSNTRQLTFEGRRSGEAYFNTDGTQLIFQSEREPGNPFFQIYTMDLETGDVQRISPGYGKTTCAWFYPADKDKDKLLFASTHEDPQARAKQKSELDKRAVGKQKRYAWDYDEYYEVYEHDRKTGRLRNLTHARGYDAEASLSPDARRIVFSSNRHAYTENLSAKDRQKFEIDKSFMVDLYIMNADGSSVRRLTDVKGYDGGPFFSPDGRRICWRRFSVEGDKAEIYTMNADGSDQRRITQLGALSWAPFYHPTQKYMIFATNKHGFGNFELYMVDVEGKHEPLRVTYTPGFDSLPAFSPDGTKMAWTSNRAPKNRSQVFLSDWNHEAALRMLEASPPSRARAQAAAAQDTSDSGASATEPDFRAEDIKLHVTRLASEEMEGRLSGSPGGRLATEYVASVFKRYGLQPAGDDGTYFQAFPFTAGVSLGARNGLIVKHADSQQEREFTVDKDWRPLAFSNAGTFDASPIVFAGYGIVAPEADGEDAYDSYVHLDVADKWVLVLRYMPEDITPERRQHLSRYSSLRYKAMTARDKGARGLLVVSGPNSNVKNQLVKLGFDASLSGSGIAAMSLTDQTADALLAPGGKTLKALQDAVDPGEPQMGFEIADVRLAASIDIRTEKRNGRNVLGRLSGGPSTASEPALLIGAHVDHLGRGAGTNSLAREDEQDAIHYGADDNASGVAAMLEIAEYLADQKRAGKLKMKRDVIFAAWSGEELGLLGSSHYVNQLAQRGGSASSIRSAIAACLNLDMVGRLDKALILNGVGSSSIWPREIERRNAPVGLKIATRDDSYLPTDATSFYIKGVPILSAFTGSHAEYHTPRDTPDTLNYPGAAQAARFMGLVARSLTLRAEEPDYIEMTQPEKGAGRAGLRAYLGTIPDYAAADILGLKISGATKGGPADKAGLKAGDVIVELAGRKIENIYDYTYAIDAVKVGQPTTIVIMRGGQKLTLTIVATARE